MTEWLTVPTRRRDAISIPIIWIAVVLSLLIHGGSLFVTLRRMHPLTAAEPAQTDQTSSLAVQLAPARTRGETAPAAPPPAQPTVVAQAARVEPPRRPPPVRIPRPSARPPAPPVITTDRSPPEPVPRVTPPAPPSTTPRNATPPPPMEGDLASYVEARRRARGEVSTAPGATPDAPPAESDRERLNRTVAANLGLNKTPTFGYDPKSAGGLFQIVRLEYDAADFYFLGLNKDINRNAKQLIEVRRGAASDIRVAVVRRMIGIIRDQVTGDFTWMSRRGSVVTLSARPADDTELQAYILRDIFPEARELH